MKSNRWYLGIILLCLCVGPLFGQAINSSDLERLSHRTKPDKPAPAEKRDDSFGNILLQAAGEMSGPIISEGVTVAPVGEKFKVFMPGPAQLRHLSNDTPGYEYGKLGRVNYFSVTVYPFPTSIGSLLETEDRNMESMNLAMRSRAAREGDLPEGVGGFYDGQQKQNGLYFYQYRHIFPDEKGYTRLYAQGDKIYLLRAYAKNEALIKRFLDSFQLGTANRNAAQSNVEDPNER